MQQWRNVGPGDGIFSLIPSHVIDLLHSLPHAMAFSASVSSPTRCHCSARTGFSFYAFQTCWLWGKFNLAFCYLPSIWLTTVNNPDLRDLEKPCWDLNSGLKITQVLPFLMPKTVPNRANTKAKNSCSSAVYPWQPRCDSSSHLHQ